MNQIKVTREASVAELDQAYGVFDSGYTLHGDAPQEDLIIAQHSDESVFASDEDAVIYACIRAGQGDLKARDALRRVFGFDADPVALLGETTPALPN